MIKNILILLLVFLNTLGHSNPIINHAVKKQLDKYSHVMVYGEYIQSPQYKLAKLLSDNLPEKLNSTYFVNSGTEAIEGVYKKNSKSTTGRSEIISCKDSYHGSTHGLFPSWEMRNKKQLSSIITRLQYN